MIRGQLGNTDVADAMCESLGADVVLRRSAENSNLAPVAILSRLGTGELKIIDPLPGELFRHTLATRLEPADRQPCRLLPAGFPG